MSLHLLRRIGDWLFPASIPYPDWYLLMLDRGQIVPADLFTFEEPYE